MSMGKFRLRNGLATSLDKNKPRWFGGTKLLTRREIERRALPWGIFSSWGSLSASVFCELCTSAEARALSFSVLELRAKPVGFENTVCLALQKILHSIY